MCEGPRPKKEDSRSPVTVQWRLGAKPETDSLEMASFGYSAFLLDSWAGSLKNSPFASTSKLISSTARDLVFNLAQLCINLVLYNSSRTSIITQTRYWVLWAFVCSNRESAFSFSSSPRQYILPIYTYFKNFSHMKKYFPVFYQRNFKHLPKRKHTYMENIFAGEVQVKSCSFKRK